MTDLLSLILPELILGGAALLLLFMGIGKSVATRKSAAAIALLALIAAFVAAARHASALHGGATLADRYDAIRLYEFGQYFKLLVCAVGILLVLLAWPSSSDAQGNPSLRFGTEASEFLGLMLLSLTGILLTASANDMVLLFLAIELVSLPTYIMVAISRPTAVAQEAAIKYFFIGAMAAAVMLFGFSYLYGTTGTTSLYAFAQMIKENGAIGALNSWQMLAVMAVLLGLTYKIAAFPMHFYAGDVYQGAATPVTAFLAFVPKTAGFVAIIKILFAITAGTWIAPTQIVNLLWIIAALTMTIGNVLGLLQFNIKRLLAYSSIAHSGYMLVGLTALLYAHYAPSLHSSQVANVQNDALRGVLFYLAAYGIANVAAFGVLSLLPAAGAQSPGSSAETLDDVAGTGRSHPILGLTMAVACFSLIGLPLTVGFFGKLFLIVPAWKAQLGGLVIITVINAAISAGYYLRIVGTMFLRPAATVIPAASATSQPPRRAPLAIAVSITLAVLAVLALGIIFPTTQALSHLASRSTALEGSTANALLSTAATPDH